VRVAPILAVLLLGSIAPTPRGEDKPPENGAILVASPFALILGQTNAVKLRGNLLTSITNVSSPPGITATLGKSADAKPPEGVDAKIGGAQRLELTVVLPTAFSSSNAALVFTTTNGFKLTNTFALLPTTTIQEHEPNGGFRNAQKVAVPCVIRAAIDPKRDVDVFEAELSTNQTIHVEIEAQRAGSILDSILTIYDSRGHIIATNDDSKERDSSADFIPTTAGPYCFAVQDAHDRGGETHPYLLRITTAERTDSDSAIKH
jgi:hypothetical protein